MLPQRRSESYWFSRAWFSLARFSLTAEQCAFRIQLDLFGPGRGRQCECSLGIVGKDNGQEVRLPLLVHRIERNGRHQIFRRVALTDYAAYFDLAASGGHVDIFQGELRHGNPVDPAVKEPLQRLLPLITQRVRQHLLKGEPQVAGGNLMVGRFSQQTFQGGKKLRVTIFSACITQHGAQHVDQPGAAAIKHELERRRKPGRGSRTPSVTGPALPMAPLAVSLSSWLL